MENPVLKIISDRAEKREIDARLPFSAPLLLEALIHSQNILAAIATGQIELEKDSHTLSANRAIIDMLNA